MPTGSGVRLGEQLAALSLVTDLGNDNPPEKALRMCLLATRIGKDLGIAGAELSDVFYTSLMRFLGCTSFATEMGRIYVEDNMVRNIFETVDSNRAALRATFTKVGAWEKGPARAKIVLSGLTKAAGMFPKLVAADCEVATRLAKRLHLSEGVATAIGQLFERYDGKGKPNGLRGDRISPAARITVVAQLAEAVNAKSDRDTAIAYLKRSRDGWFDPAVVDAFLAHADEYFDAIAQSVWDTVLDEEPAPRPYIRVTDIDDIALAFADFTDLKSPYTLGHSSGVSALAERAAVLCRLGDEAATAVRRAALLHDIGRVSVGAGVWDKRGALSAAEWERVRLHAYHTERIMSASPILEPLGRIAGLHHERLDGSGYHRSAPPAMQTQEARVLAASDVFHAMTERRPHREAFTPDVAAKEIQAMASAGRLDPQATSAVVEAAGLKPDRRGMWPAGLTEREVEVLRLAAQGLSKKEIANALFISPSTAHTHVVHVYEKIGVSTRAGAALFAMEHALIPGNRPNSR